MGAGTQDPEEYMKWKREQDRKALEQKREQDRKALEQKMEALFGKSIKLLENILPQEFHQEWLGDLRERYYQLIEEHTSLRKVYFITLFTGLGLIRSYLWLKADKFVSRWMTRAK
jgi:hypothetical protein